MKIRRINQTDIDKKLCEKELLLFSDNKQTIYYGYFDDYNMLKGFVGMTIYKNKVILKNDYVYKEYRGQGIFRELNIFRFNLIKDMGIKIIEANVTPIVLPIHIKNGCEIIKEYKNGITKIVYKK